MTAANGWPSAPAKGRSRASGWWRAFVICSQSSSLQRRGSEKTERWRPRRLARRRPRRRPGRHETFAGNRGSETQPSQPARRQRSGRANFMTDTILLDGYSLTIEQLVRIAREGARVEIDPATDERVAASEQLIAQVVENYRRAWEAGEPAPTEYGVTTGFGEFKDKPIAPADLEQLQRNLLLSHSVGVGENCDPDDLANYFPADVVRAVLATRLNSFLQGHSGVRRKLVDIVQAMLNRGVIPLVPLRGSVGASGDLCPLSHTFATLLGAGRFYIAGTKELRDASELPALLGFNEDKMKPTFKEGLALVNGVNFSASMLAFGVADAERLADLADAAAAMTLEAMCGCTRALDPKVHAARGHAGQIASAARMRAMIGGSKLAGRSGAVW